MRTLRLKPIFLSNEEILIPPPEGTTRTHKRQQVVVKDIDQLRKMTRGRQLRKKEGTQNTEGDCELVRRLNDFSIYRTVSEGPQETKAISPFKLAVAPSTRVTDLLIRQKSLRKELHKEISKVTAHNLKAERTYNQRFQSLNEGIKQLTEKMAELLECDRAIREEMVSERTAYDKAAQDLQTRLSSLTRGLAEAKCKKTRLGEVDRLFMDKEKIKAEKQASTQDFLKVSERQEARMNRIQAQLEETRHNRRIQKKELKILRGSLGSFYCGVIKQGVDLREDGIRWAIKALWAMDEPVPVSTFPKYLDQESAHFLLLMAKNEVELKELQTKLEGLKHQLKTARARSVTRRTQKELHRVVLFRLRQLSTSLQTEKQTEEVGPTLQGTLLHHQLGQIRENIQRLTAEMKQASREEMERVKEEFDEGVQKVTFEQVVQCLFGEKAQSVVMLGAGKGKQGEIIYR